MRPALALTLCLVAGCVGGSGAGEVHGLVVNDIYRPIQGVEISLQGTEFRTTTDVSGSFSFRGVAAGPYILLATAPNHDPVRLPIEVPQSRSLEVELEMRRLPPAVRTEATWATGTTTVNAAMWGLDSTLAHGIRALEVQVPPGATRLLVDLRWWSVPVGQDLDLEVHAPRGGGPVDWTGCAMGDPGVWCEWGGSAVAPDESAQIDLHAHDLEPYAEAGCEGTQYGECNVYLVGIRVQDVNAQVDWRVGAMVEWFA